METRPFRHLNSKDIQCLTHYVLVEVNFLTDFVLIDSLLMGSILKTLKSIVFENSSKGAGLCQSCEAPRRHLKSEHFVCMSFHCFRFVAAR